MSQLDFENSLNDQQLIAVNCNEGNKLVLAGAGSGKTRVLTYRIAKLIQDFNVRPSDVLALTFTNKASREMKDRIESILKISSQGLWFGTFHGICRRILKIHWREAELSERFTILDSQDQLRLIKRILKAIIMMKSSMILNQFNPLLIERKIMDTGAITLAIKMMRFM